jgi:hypothetical protein
MKNIKIQDLKKGDYIHDSEIIANRLISGRFLYLRRNEMHYKPDKNDNSWETSKRSDSYKNDDYWTFFSDITILEKDDIDLLNLQS